MIIFFKECSRVQDEFGEKRGAKRCFRPWADPNIESIHVIVAGRAKQGECGVKGVEMELAVEAGLEIELYNTVIASRAASRRLRYGPLPHLALVQIQL